jgi:hypothetical protein
MTCMNPRGHGAFRAFAHPTLSALAMIVIATIAAQVAALAQNLDIKRYNPSEWTKGRFSEVVTVTGPGKTIYLAGVGAEEENAPRARALRSGTSAIPTSSAAMPMTRSSACWPRMAPRWRMR